MSGAREQFDIQYRNLKEPPAMGGKVPDLQGRRWESTHIGAVDTSAADLRTAPDLGALVRYVVANPSVSLHVAVAFDKRHKRTALLQMGGHGAYHRIWLWPFSAVDQTYDPEPRLRVG